MKRILTLGLALLMLILAGCSTEVTEYRQQQPALDIFHYFQGRTEAWGMVQDRSGKQLRRFHVEIDGDVVLPTARAHPSQSPYAYARRRIARLSRLNIR